MFVHILSLQFAGFFGGDIGNLLATWEQAGVFSYVLPFLLIFAVVFGILMKIKVFGENRGINAVIALVVGLLSLQFQLVPVFFSEIFPQLGVGLSVLLALIILTGLFFSSEENKVVNYLLLAVAVIIFLTVIYNTATNLGFYSGYWWSANWQWVILVAAVIGILAAVITSGAPKKEMPPIKLNWGK